MQDSIGVHEPQAGTSAEGGRFPSPAIPYPAIVDITFRRPHCGAGYGGSAPSLSAPLSCGFNGP
jgi:hypothetical protein